VKPSDRLHASWIDQLLAATGAIAAAYSSGMSVSRPTVALFFAVCMAAAAILGVANSFWISKTKIARYDGIALVVVLTLSIVFALRLNSLLPEGGYPRSILIGGILSWMMLGGLLVAWRDHTLLFLSVPCIALFGFVGSWDIYGGAVWLFFLFLACSVTLFARSHLRTMLRTAAARGQSDHDQLKKGPWRWMAGPEIALASALVIVLLSLLGAPAFQSTVQGVAGALPLTTIQPPPIAAGRMSFGGDSNSAIIGRGPAGNISPIPVLSVKIAEPRLLRGTTFGTYQGSQWVRLAHPMTEADVQKYGRRDNFLYDGLATLKDPVSIDFEVVIQSGLHRTPYWPGEYRSHELDDLDLRIRSDGSLWVESGLTQGVIYQGQAWVAGPKSPGIKAGNPPVPPWSNAAGYYETKEIPDRVRALARQIVQGRNTDRAKADAILDALSERCTYDLQAERAPPGADPVEYFLFESKRGYCDLFASAYALLARSVGLPSRYVTGFLMQPEVPDARGFYTVRASDYHAWAEVFFEGAGWVAFDATERADTAPGSNRGGIPVPEQKWYEMADTETLINIGLTFCAALLVVVLAWPTQRRTRDPEVNRQRALDSTFVRLQRALQAQTGRGRHIFETPNEHLQRIETLLGRHIAEAQDLSKTLENWIFSGHTPSESELKSIRQRIAALHNAKSDSPKSRKAA